MINRSLVSVDSKRQIPGQERRPRVPRAAGDCAFGSAHVFPGQTKAHDVAFVELSSWCHTDDLSASPDTPTPTRPQCAFVGYGTPKAIELQDVSQVGPHPLNFCNDSALLRESGLARAALGQFLGYSCSPEFFHCRWQPEGFLTFRKLCRTELVYDTEGTQNCNYDFNVKGCNFKSAGNVCQNTEFSCPFSEACVPLEKRCDGHYDCLLEEDEQNCPMCGPEEFACVVSEQCVSISLRCNGVGDCSDGTDELDCDKCGNGGFFCQKSGECVQGEQRCDGVPQCRSGEDEILCKAPMSERLYTCENRRQTVPMRNVCDGVEECLDGSDERYCLRPFPLSFSSLSSKGVEKAKPVFPVLPFSGAFASPQSARGPTSASEFSSDSDGAISAYDAARGVPSGVTNQVAKETTISKPAFSLPIPQPISSERNLRTPPPTSSSQSPPYTRKHDKIPVYTGHTGRKTFFGGAAASVVSTVQPRVVVEVTSWPATPSEDDLLRRTNVAKSKKKSARDLLLKLETMLAGSSAHTEEPKASQTSITVTRSPARKWHPSLSGKAETTAVPPKVDRRVDVFMHHYDRFRLDASRLNSASVFGTRR
ncbi:hypothetical protein QR680_017461 [Steinernema hermaphroditum]|uniref:Chitin-binding type-2 domain-containing protein n=1 Tax=Steinernema hermaphroditum TaxID=289476 RepID=A0AA39HGU0_9BILA|nr:hypothetical protein QR680_017461 [Steinernema hermaphroditum]